MIVNFHIMRILHLAKYYWPRSGGMERVVQGLAEGVAERGHEAEVIAITAFGDPPPGKKRRTPVKRAWSFAPVGTQELAPAYLAAAWKRADVIHLHHPNSLADVAYALRPSLAPLVVTQHADYPSFKYKLPSRYALWRAEAIVVPSRAHIALCSELRGFEEKVAVIPFGIDERRWEVVPPPPPGNPPRALFIGHLQAYKGVDFLLRALELVPDLRLDIVGSGPQANRLKTLARALAVEDRVKWYGEYPDEDLPRRMADADFLVLPSVSVEEMFGLVLLEAMAAGRPVITTDVPSGVREVNQHGVTGLEVPMRDVTALADAMRTLAEDPELRDRLGRAGRRRVRERFSLAAMTDAHIALYQKVRGPKSIAAVEKSRKTP
jgi:rhamnosyl/mannosyltransferase